MTRLVLCSLAVIVLTFAGIADAQVCGGFASFTQGPYQVFGSARFSDDAKSFGGGFAFGGAGAFGGVSLGTTSYDDFEGSTFTVGGTGGYAFTLGQEGIVHLCPTASVQFSSGPNDIDVFGDGSLIVDLSETDFVLGLGMGVLASRSAQTQIIPTASLAFVSATLKVSDDVSGDSESESETFGLLGLGLGFVFNQVFTLRPSVSIPLGLDDASTSFGVSFGVNFGRKGP